MELAAWFNELVAVLDLMEAEAAASAVPTGPTASGGGVGTSEGGVPEPSPEVNPLVPTFPHFPPLIGGPAPPPPMIGGSNGRNGWPA